MVEEVRGSENKSVPTMPGTATDLVRALRELLGLIKDAVGLLGDGIKIYDRQRSRKAAQRLYNLSFAPQGMRGPLQRLACGEGTTRDLTQIEEMLQATASDVENDIEKLGQLEPLLREKLGWEAADLLDQVIYSPFGKKVTRVRLGEMVALGKQSPQPMGAIKDKAAEIDAQIGELNANLQRLHDWLLQRCKDN